MLLLLNVDVEVIGADENNGGNGGGIDVVV
jgi:hypothetical protein